MPAYYFVWILTFAIRSFPALPATWATLAFACILCIACWKGRSSYSMASLRNRIKRLLSYGLKNTATFIRSDWNLKTFPPPCPCNVTETLRTSKADERTSEMLITFRIGRSGKIDEPLFAFAHNCPFYYPILSRILEDRCLARSSAIMRAWVSMLLKFTDSCQRSTVGSVLRGLARPLPRMFWKTVAGFLSVRVFRHMA
jgi:hypothetical protein